MKKIKVLELFGGIGAPRKALENLGIKCEFVDYVEIDKNPVNQYNSIFGTNHVSKNIISWVPKKQKIDLIIHGSPCQDFSIAGKGDVENGGRSILYLRTLDIVKEVKPKYVVWENVKGLLSKKHKHHFEHYLKSMESFGYRNYYKILNSIDFGIPQKRERVFTISIREDVKNDFDFENLKKRKMKPLKSFLEKNVDISYFIKKDSLIGAIESGKIKIINNNEYEVNKDCDYRMSDGSSRKAGVIRPEENNIIIPLTNNHSTNIVNIADLNSNIQTLNSTNRQRIAVRMSSLKWKNGVVKIPFSTFNQENYVTNVEGGCYRQSQPQARIVGLSWRLLQRIRRIILLFQGKVMVS